MWGAVPALIIKVSRTQLFRVKSDTFLFRSKGAFLKNSDHGILPDRVNFTCCEGCCPGKVRQGAGLYLVSTRLKLVG